MMIRAIRRYASGAISAYAMLIRERRAIRYALLLYAAAADAIRFKMPLQRARCRRIIIERRLR